MLEVVRVCGCPVRVALEKDSEVGGSYFVELPEPLEQLVQHFVLLLVAGRQRIHLLAHVFARRRDDGPPRLHVLPLGRDRL